MKKRLKLENIFLIIAVPFCIYEVLSGSNEVECVWGLVFSTMAIMICSYFLKEFSIEMAKKGLKGILKELFYK